MHDRPRTLFDDDIPRDIEPYKEGFGRFLDGMADVLGCRDAEETCGNSDSTTQ